VGGEAPIHQQVYAAGEALDPFLVEQWAFASVFQQRHFFSSPLFADWEKRLAKQGLLADLLLSEAADLGVAVHANGWANSGDPAFSGVELAGALRGKPALVVGSGPSLRPHLAQVEQACRSAVVIAAGSAAAKVRAPFAAALDPQFTWNQQIASHLFFPPRLAPAQRVLAGGDRFLFPDSSWKSLSYLAGCDGLFPGGWTAATFALQCALHLGCNPIAFVGLDGWKEKGEGPRSLNRQGALVATQNDWIAAADWIGQLAEANPSTTFLDLGGAGLPIGGPVASAPFSALRGAPLSFSLPPLPLVTPRTNEWREAMVDAKRTLAQWQAPTGIVHELLLSPLWARFYPLFARRHRGSSEDLALQELLFYQQVVDAHLGS
jgi:hypothetical protein